MQAIRGKHVGPELTTNRTFAIASHALSASFGYGEVRPEEDIPGLPGNVSHAKLAVAV
jgi:hypothetical protein